MIGITAYGGYVILASDTLPFAERLNAGIVAGALTLADDVEAMDVGGAQRAGLSALAQAVARVKSAQSNSGNVLVLAADNRRTRAGSAQELDYGDAAAALLIGSDNVVPEVLGSAALSVDFVDHFRGAGEDVDYRWEERWVRDEGIAKPVSGVVASALAQAGVQASEVDHFIFPSTFAKMDAQLAKTCGLRAEAVVGNLAESVRDSGPRQETNP